MTGKAGPQQSSTASTSAAGERGAANVANNAAEQTEGRAGSLTQSGTMESAKAVDSSGKPR